MEYLKDIILELINYTIPSKICSVFGHKYTEYEKFSICRTCRIIRTRAEK